jgi:glycosyltransferase involved in cell wall biosynthesis
VAWWLYCPILANTHPNFELVVVDQSKDDETLEALRPFGADPRLKYAKIATAGKGSALNADFTETKGSVIAITDDNCTVPSKWLENLPQYSPHTRRSQLLFVVSRPASMIQSKAFIPDAATRFSSAIG